MGRRFDREHGGVVLESETPVVSRWWLEAAVAATSVAEQEAALTDAYEIVAARHDAASITAHVDPATRQFHRRPYRVLSTDRFADACRGSIKDPWLP